MAADAGRSRPAPLGALVVAGWLQDSGGYGLTLTRIERGRHGCVGDVGMKYGTIRHPKLLALATALEMRPFEALGLLEALLDWTYHYATRGDVGRFSDADIAAGIGYPGDPVRLVAVLVTTRWLDRCAAARLVVHDLAEHASWSWRRTLQRRHIDFAAVVPPVPPASGATAGDLVPPRATYGGPAEPSRAEPIRAEPSRARLARAREPEGFAEFWAAYPRHEGKETARRAWGKLGAAPPLGAIIGALEWQRQSPRWCEEAGRFVPHPATYLNNRRWEDEPPAPPALSTTARTAGNLAAIQAGLELVRHDRR